MQCGFELEVSNGAASVRAALFDAGLTAHDRIHGYHCSCSQCDPFAMTVPFKVQEDGSCDGEVITRVLDYGSDEMGRAIAGLSHVLLTTGARVDGGVGNHVHMSNEGTDGASDLRLIRLMARYEADLREIAGGRRELRTYNGEAFSARAEVWEDETPRVATDRWSNVERQMQPFWYCGSSWLSFKSHTHEFRLWNSTRAAWRMRMHVGVSHAFMQAALAGEDVTRDDPRCFESVLGPYFDTDTWAGIIRQRYSKGGLELVA